MSKVPRMHIARSIADMLDNGVSGKELTKTVAAYLVHERRTRELDPLMRDVQNIRAARGTLEATSTSAFPLSPKVKQEINQILKTGFGEPKKIILDEQIDKSVIGGVRLETTDKQLDTTVQAKLNKLKQAAA